MSASGAPNALARTLAHVRSAVTYALAFRVVRSLTATTAPTPTTATATATAARGNDVAATTSSSSASFADVVARNLYVRGEMVDLRLYATTARDVSGDFDDDALHAPVFARRDLRLAVDGVDATTLDFASNAEVTHAISQNVTVMLHAVLTRVRSRRGRAFGAANATDALRASVALTTHRRVKKRRAARHLLARSRGDDDGGGAATSANEDGDAKDVVEDDEAWVTYFKPNMTLSIVDDFNAYRAATIPDVLSQRMRFADDARSAYYPTVYFNEFWLLESYLRRIGDGEGGEDDLKLKFDVAPLHMVKWQMQETTTRTWQQQRDFGVSGANDADQMKKMFLEGNPVLLAVTAVVSLLHTLFDILAFKNDVSFWKSNKSMEGLSARSVSLNAVMQLIILLYLLDNDTSWMILFSSFTGTVIEFWKVTKAMDVSVERGGILGFLPRVRVAPKASALKSETAKHDADAMRFLSYALYPMCAAYALYDLYHNEHRGWWSWIISSLVGSIYVFGFISMTPQLYINYKLKSVAAMPWKQMSYKFLNTIIDDLFAFVIKMPTLHRLSVFRDDVIFIAFLYQRRIYRVDSTRVNEFGYSGDVAAAAANDDDTNDDETKKDR